MRDSAWRDCLQRLGRLDKLALLFHLLLLLTGIAFIYGVGIEIGGDMATKWYMQVAWLAAGTVLYLFCALTDYHRLGHFSWLLYAFSLLLLILVLLVGLKINNARSWLRLGAGINIQPAEFAKPATLLFMAWAVTHPAWRRSPVPSWLLVGLIALPPFALVLLQPDFGTGLVFLPVSLTIAFLKGLRWRWLLLGAAAAITLAPVLYLRLSPYQQTRIKVFLEPPAHAAIVAIAPFVPDAQLDALRRRQDQFFAQDANRPRDNWNALQSLLAIGSGGMTGKGYLKGTQHILGYLPKNVAPTDFIFSVIAEETGFFGAATLMVAFIGFILCCCRTALLAADEFGICLAAGVAAILATHVFVNIAMTVQAAPIIGIPLPFVSYGGSFMLSTMILAGLAQSVHIHRDGHLRDDPHDATP